MPHQDAIKIEEGSHSFLDHDSGGGDDGGTLRRRLRKAETTFVTMGRSVVHRGGGGGGGGGGGSGGGGGISNRSNNDDNDGRDCEQNASSFSASSNEKSRRPKAFFSFSFRQSLSSWRTRMERKLLYWNNNNSVGGNQSRFIIFIILLVSILVIVVVFLLYPLSKWTIYKIVRLIYGPPPPPPYLPLDFIVAGFPKCGTTTLLKTLAQHVEIAMPNAESCQLARPLQQDDVNLKQLQSDLYELLKRQQPQQQQQQQQQVSSSASKQPKQQRQQQQSKLLLGIKCPDALKNFKTIHRLSQHSPHTKFIIGLRHPLLYLQSLYNYRVLEVHLGKKKSGNLQSLSLDTSRRSSNNATIPTLQDIFQSSEQTQISWWDVSPLAPRFEVYLAQFCKTNLSVQEMHDWFRPPTLHDAKSHSNNNATTTTITTTTATATMTNAGSALYSMLAMKPNHFQIFIYTLNQLQQNDKDEGVVVSSNTTAFSSTTFRRDLQRFLGLQHPIAPFGHDNRNQAASGTRTKSNDRGSIRNASSTSTSTSSQGKMSKKRHLSSFSSFTSLFGLVGDVGDGVVANNNNVASGSEQGSRRTEQEHQQPLLPGMIDICHPDYNALRSEVLRHYRTVTLPWLANQFLASTDVVTSQPEFFVTTLREWTVDPCTTSSSSAIINRQRPR
jgi:Sulfotransferase family